MEYILTTKGIQNKIARIGLIIMFFVGLFLLILIFFAYFSILDIFWKCYFTIPIIFLTILVFGSIIYVEIYWKQKGDPSIFKIQIGDEEIKFYRNTNSFSIKYDWFMNHEVLVKVASSNRWHPAPKVFKFYDFLEKGYEYIRKELEKISPNRRDKTLIILNFYEQKSKLSTRLLFPLSVSLSILPLSDLKQMLDEWKEKYESYFKDTSKQKEIKVENRYNQISRIVESNKRKS